MTYSVAKENPVDRWNPYIPVPNSTGLNANDLASDVLRAVLADNTLRKAADVVAALHRKEISSLPLAVQSLDHETDGFLTRRILNMVAALGRFLSEPQHADVREKLWPVFWPIPGWVKGQYCVTSPAELVLYASFYSDIEWFRDHFFEAFSAARAFEELKSQGFPAAHCRFVAALISHQTLLRVACNSDDESDPREVLPFYQAGVSRLEWVEKQFIDPARGRLEADRAVGRALARTLFPFVAVAPGNAGGAEPTDIPRFSRQLASALVLHSLCLSSRHHRGEPEWLPRYEAQALPFLDHLLNTETRPGCPEPSLACLQYGRYVHLKAPQLLAEAKETVLGREPVQPPQGNTNPRPNITVSFKRVSTLKVWANRNFDQNCLSPVAGFGAQAAINSFGNNDIWDLINPIVGSAYRYDVDASDYLLCALGVNQDE